MDKLNGHYHAINISVLNLNLNLKDSQKLSIHEIRLSESSKINIMRRSI